METNMHSVRQDNEKLHLFSTNYIKINGNIRSTLIPHYTFLKKLIKDPRAEK